MAHWLAAQRVAGREPSTATALARLIECDQKTVVYWIEKGSRPRADILHRLARVMGVDQAWLTNDDVTEWPPVSLLERAAALLSGLTPEEQEALIAGASDPRGRQVVIGYGRALLAETEVGRRRPQPPRP